MTLLIIVWDALVRFSELPGGWFVPLAFAVIFLLCVYYLIEVCVEGVHAMVADRRERESKVVDLALRRRQLNAAVNLKGGR